jgi:hypothetical protein
LAALATTLPLATGTTWTPAAVSASDTITQAQLGTLGAYLVVINGGGSSDTVAITDGGLTPAGNAGTSSGGAVANATTKAFYISPRAVSSAGLVTVTHSFTTTVNYVLLPIG